MWARGSGSNPLQTVYAGFSVTQFCFKGGGGLSYLNPL